jgi:hypothetical protein
VESSDGRVCAASGSALPTASATMNEVAFIGPRLRQ